MLLLCGRGCDRDWSRGGAVFGLCTSSFAAVAGYTSRGNGLIYSAKMEYAKNSTYIKSARLHTRLLEGSLTIDGYDIVHERLNGHTVI